MASIAPPFSSTRNAENDGLAREVCLSWLKQMGATDISQTTFPSDEALAYDIKFFYAQQYWRAEIERKKVWKQASTYLAPFAINGNIVSDIQFPLRKQLKLRDEKDLAPDEMRYFTKPSLRATMFVMINAFGDRLLSVAASDILQAPIEDVYCKNIGETKLVSVPCGRANFWLLRDDKWEKDTINGRYSNQENRR